ncbi:MAG: H-NS family nucleoid-associated regulatory protein [Gemmobacter sp.]
MDINLNTMNLKELKELQAQVTRAIASFEDRRKKAAIAELEEKARELGFSFAELSRLGGGKVKSASSAKYANPADPSDTWTGRGRKPRWFIEALATGRKPEDMAI